MRSRGITKERCRWGKGREGASLHLGRQTLHGRQVACRAWPSGRGRRLVKGRRRRAPCEEAAGDTERDRDGVQTIFSRGPSGQTETGKLAGSWKGEAVRRRLGFVREFCGSGIPARGCGAGSSRPGWREATRQCAGPASPGAKLAEVPRNPGRSAPDSFFQPPGTWMGSAWGLRPEGMRAAPPADPQGRSPQPGSTAAMSPSAQPTPPVPTQMPLSLCSLSSSSDFLVK